MTSRSPPRKYPPAATGLEVAGYNVAMNAIRANAEAIKHLRQRYYFSVLEKQFLQYRKKYGLPAACDHLTAMMQGAKGPVEKLIKGRFEAGIIRNMDQTRKSLAGNGFQALVLLSLTELQKAKLVPPTVQFTLKPKQSETIREFAAIYSGDETLSPDLDLMASADGIDTVCIYSIKTSLRERAGQTQRWKLLFDIATAPDSDSIRKKYDIRYDGGRDFRMNLITSNFYNEITSPQQRGLLRFFDRVYLTKPGTYNAPVMNFSQVAKDLKKLYGK